MDSNTTSLDLKSSNTFKMPTSEKTQNSQQNGTNYSNTSDVLEFKTVEKEYTFEELLQVADKGVELNAQDDTWAVSYIQTSVDFLMRQEQNFADQTFVNTLNRVIEAYNNASGNRKALFEQCFPEQYAYFKWISNEYLNNFIPANEIILSIQLLENFELNYDTVEYIDYILTTHSSLTPEQRKYLPESIGSIKAEGTVLHEIASLKQDILNIKYFGEELCDFSQNLLGKNNELELILNSFLRNGEGLNGILNTIIRERMSKRGTIYVSQLQNKSIEEKLSIVIEYIIQEISAKISSGEIMLGTLISFEKEMEKRFFDKNSYGYGGNRFGERVVIGENTSYLSSRSKNMGPQFIAIYDKLKKLNEFHSDMDALQRLYDERSIFPSYQDYKVAIETKIIKLEKKYGLEHKSSAAELFQEDPIGFVRSCGVSFLCGMLDLAEGALDLVLYGTGTLFAGVVDLWDDDLAQEFRDTIQTAIQYDMTESLYVASMELANVDEEVYNNSVARSMQSGGKLVGLAALTVICPAAAPAISATSLAGSAIEDSFLNGATYFEAGVIGVVTWTTSYFCGQYLKGSTDYVKGMVAAVIKPIFTSAFEYMCYMDHVDENGNPVYKSLWDYYEKDGTYIDAGMAALFAIWKVRKNQQKSLTSNESSVAKSDTTTIDEKEILKKYVTKFASKSAEDLIKDGITAELEDAFGVGESE